MARRRVNTTRYEIIQTATRLFLEIGYSHTTPKMICDALDISTGNLTYYFPTKEHLLAELVEMLCEFQVHLLREEVEEEGLTSLSAMCLEVATMAAAADQCEIAKDLFLSAYRSPLCLEMIRRNDTQRSMQIYKDYCPNWDEKRFICAETMVSGVEYATMMTTGDLADLEYRVAGALEVIMRIYNVPEDVRKQKIKKILAMDYQKKGPLILEHFKRFVQETNEQTFQQLRSSKQE